MKGIPHIIQTKQDVLNLHKMAMKNKINKKEWKIYLTQLIQPDKYIFPILKVEEDCFYIPYTELPLDLKYKKIDKVDTLTNQNNILAPDNNDYTKDSDICKVDLVYNPNYHLPEIINESDYESFLKIYAKIDKEANQLILYYGCPFYDITGITPQEVNRLLKELI